MEARSLLMVGLLVATFSLAGCLDGEFSNGPDGQSASGEGSLAYNGSGSGTQSDDFQCDGTGTVDWSVNNGGGSITITVTDGSGAQVFSKSHGSFGQAAQSKSISGAAGEWTVKVTRSGFSGQYAVSVDC